MKTSKRTAAINTSKIRALFDLAKTIYDPRDLSLGVPAMDVPQAVKDEAIKEILSGKPGYSQNAGILEVREKVADKLKSRNGINAEAGEVVITSGVTAGLWLSLAALVDDGDEVIVFDPYFAPYINLISFLGGRPIKVNTYPNWDIPWDVLKKSITKKTKAILFNSPNNPTGKVYDRNTIDRLAVIAEKYGLWIISDEIYEDVVFDREHVSIGAIYPKTITLMGPSKSASLCGYRIAYLHAEKMVVNEIVKLQQLFYVCAPLPAQMALSKSLSLDYGSTRDFYRAKRDIVRSVLGGFPGMEGSFYAFINSGRKNAEGLVKDLIKERVLTVPGSAFSEINTHFRISYSVPDRTLEEALIIIAKNLK